MTQNKFTIARVLVVAAVAAVCAFGLLASSALVPMPEATGGWVYIKEQPTLVVSPFPVPYAPKTRVMIAGSGFEPKQEIGLQIDIGGVPSDISFMVKPRPVANEFGAFMSEWVVAAEIKAKLLSPTAYTLRAVDENGTVIAHAPVVFVVVKKDKKDGKKKE